MRLNIEMKKIENNYCLEYNNGSVLFCSEYHVKHPNSEMLYFGLYSNYTIFRKFVNTLILKIIAFCKPITR